MELLKAIYQRLTAQHIPAAEVSRSVITDFHGCERFASCSQRIKAQLLATTDPTAGWDPRIDTSAQNLMLAAHGFGLSASPIGFARPRFNLPEIKSGVGIPSSNTTVLPIIIGHQAEPAAQISKREPDRLGWHWDA